MPSLDKPKTGKILIVDDEPNNRLILKGMIQKLGHEPNVAENATEALNLLDRSFDLVLTDAMMPGMNGFEMVMEIRRNPETKHIPIIMVTTLSEKEDRLRSVEAGANDFISKPIDMVELRVRVTSMLNQKTQYDEIQLFQDELQNIVELRTQELLDALRELDQAHVESIQNLSAAAEYKDDDTAQHIRRMSGYSALIAQKLGLEKEMVDLIRVTSPMHDVGKIGIPDHILLKPGKLSPDEWEVMKTHSEIGAKILRTGTSRYMTVGTEIALSHHERWDGSGYPFKLKGEDIPLVGRICAVADVFDALTSKRPYKEAYSVKKTLSILEEGRGSHFDPKVLDAFLQNMGEALEIKLRHSDD